MSIRHCKVIFSSITFILFIFVQIKAKEIKFEHISVEQGLSHTKVFCIFQDSRGFMWFGTEDGLNKYDGYKFTVYRHNPADSFSLGNSEVRDIYEDLSGNIWIATSGGGLNRFERATEHFTRFTNDRNNPSSIPSNFINRITSHRYDDKELFWIGTHMGLSKFDTESEKFTLFSHTDKGYPYSYIEAMAVDSAGKVWIGSSGDGLHRFDPETGKYTSYRHDPDIPGSISDNQISSLYWHKSGILWIGTVKGGLNRFDPKNNRFISYRADPANKYAVSSDWITSIYEDRRGTFWLTTAYGGLNIFNRQTERFSSFMHDPGDPNSISDNTAMCIFEDRSGILWVGTWGGIDKFDSGKSQFVNITEHASNGYSLSGSYICSICKSNDVAKPALWIGTKTNGLNKLDLTTGEVKHFKHDPANPNSILSNLISSLYEDRSGILWIGTYGDGLIKYDRKLKRFFRYENDPANPNSISSNLINCISEDSYGKLWIGTQGDGLNCLNKKTHRFTHPVEHCDTRYIIEDKSGNLWIVCAGLKKLDLRTGRLTSYWHNPEDSLSISSNTATVIYESLQNGRPVLWIGTIGGGLNRFDYESGKFERYTISDGLPSNNINGILEDKDGNLWLSTNNGLSRFDPHNESFRNFDAADGLLSNKFNMRACCTTEDGKMYFGSVKGLTAFFLII
jgi:two-component system sensor histidine kinase ChiS